jgi:predicted small lipoprotein YifL
MRAGLTTLLLLFVFFALGACGQTGPLYLPEAFPEEQPKEMPKKEPASEDGGQTGPAEKPNPSETPE